MRGTIETRLADGLVVVVGGVGFRVFSSATTLAAAGAPGDQVHLHTYLHVREDILALYGFASPDERETFEQLLTVTGVGPRVALNLLSAFEAESLRGAVSRGDADLLTRVPGIGRKTAERVILELKGKLGARPSAAAPAGATSVDGDVLAALTTLGFAPAEAQEAIRSLPGDAPRDVEERLKLALRYFQRR